MQRCLPWVISGRSLHCAMTYITKPQPLILQRLLRSGLSRKPIRGSVGLDLGSPRQVRGQTPAARNNSANLSVCPRRAVPRGFYQVAGRRDACAACSLCLAPFSEYLALLALFVLSS